MMKLVKRVGVVLLSLPIILIIIFILYEIFGMCINHIATKRQTDKLQINLENKILDIKIVDVYSETGNTSGTGNHVDCLSAIKFSTKMQESEIENSMSEYYEFNEWSCFVNRTDDGNYVFYLNTSAPFKDNIEGH
ncbi:MAG: hypothetical protein K2K56_05910 [Lachnospiraceae bacterium]|nr:hypothetical protein [Lachnospiraceae bacterium]